MQINLVRLGLSLFVFDAIIVFFGCWIAIAGRPSYTASALFNLDVENSLAVWWSSSKLLLVALLLAMVAFAGGRSGWPNLPALLAAGFVLLMSCSETANIHGLLQIIVSDRLGISGGRHGPADMPVVITLVMIPALLLGAYLLVSATRLIRQVSDGKALVILGFAIIMTGAIGLDMMRGMLTDLYIADRLLPAAEESLEIIGSTVMLVGTAKVLLSIARLTLEPLRAGVAGAPGHAPVPRPEHEGIWQGTRSASAACTAK